MMIAISRADPQQYRVIADVWDRSWHSSQPPVSKQNDLDELVGKLSDAAWDVWVARDSDRIMAFMAIDRAACWLAQLFVDPGAQNRGIGLRLFQLATAEMPDGFSFRTDETNLAARRFYERLGCALERTEDGRAYYIWRPAAGRPD